MQTILNVQGMTCGHCEGRVSAALSAVAGVASATADRHSQRAVVQHAAGVSAQTLADAVVGSGYAAETTKEIAADSDDEEPQPLPAVAAPTPPAAESPPLAANIRLQISGMTCAACVASIERGLQSLPGVTAVSVNLLLNQADVRFDPKIQQTRVLIAKVSALGYQAKAAEQGAIGSMQQAEQPTDPITLWRIVYALAVGIVTMAMPMSPQHHHNDSKMLWVALVLSLSVLLFVGGPFYRRAIAALRHKSADMNVLIALGVSAAFALSTWVTIFGDEMSARGLPTDTWFDAIPWILGLVLLGQLLEDRAKRKTGDALRQLATLGAKSARLIDGEGERDVPLEAICPGDRVRIRAGERIPVDGVIVGGSASVDESMVTGESQPVLRAVDSAVIGGTLNLDGQLDVATTAVGADSQLARIVAAVQQAQLDKPEIQRLTDRAAAIFVPAVVAIALLTVAVWTWLAPAPTALWFGLLAGTTVLIVACPCAMGLAVPTAVMVAVGRAAQIGLLIRSGPALEHLAKVTAVVFDKTGTLTLGQPEVVEFIPTSSSQASEVLAYFAAAQRDSSHPLAQAIARYARAHIDGRADFSATEVTARPGRGVTCQVDKYQVAAGNGALMAELGVDVSAFDGAARRNAEQSLVYCAVDGQALGLCALRDAMRPTSAAAVERLRQMGMEIHLLSGDRLAVAQAVATLAQISHVSGDATPEKKVQVIKDLQRSGAKVLMVGDGINDAPALATANVAFAMGSGTEVAIASSDFALMRSDLHGVADAVELSRAAMRNIAQNLFWAFGYNVLCIPLAAGVFYPWLHVLVSPVLASAAMALSSVSVVANALRLRAWKSGRADVTTGERPR